MEKIIKYLLFSSVVIGGLLTACQSNTDKVADAKQSGADHTQQLVQAPQQVNAAYPAFKKDAEDKIAANDKRIESLKAKIAELGKSPMDDMRSQKIEDLRKQNADLRAELYGYEKERSDWETFKTKFNSDADKLSKAFSDFGNDLEKKS